MMYSSLYAPFDNGKYWLMSSVEGILRNASFAEEASKYHYTYKDKYQEGYDAGFEKGCFVGAEMTRGAKDLQDEFDSLYGESESDHLSHIMMDMADCLIMIGGDDYGWETREDVIQHFKRLQK